MEPEVGQGSRQEVASRSGAARLQREAFAQLGRYSVLRKAHSLRLRPIGFLEAWRTSVIKLEGSQAPPVRPSMRTVQARNRGRGIW
jgi:hypothetical protein